MRLIRAIRLPAAILAALAVVMAGCGGGDDTVSAEEYVDDVCTAMVDLTATVEEGQVVFRDALESPEDGRDALADYLDGAVNSTADTRGDVEDAGVPDVEGGEEISDAIVTALGQLEMALETARDDAREMSVDSQQQFATEAQEIAEAIQVSSIQIQESLGAVAESEELSQAATESEACRSI